MMRLLRTFVTRLTRCSLFAAFLVACGPALAFAQAAPPAPEPPPAGHEESLEFAFIGTTGNSSTQTFGLNGESIMRPGKWVVRNKAAFIRNESDAALTAESFKYQFRAERVLNPRASAFGEYTYFRDQFAGVESQNNLIGGLSYKVVNLPAHTLSVDGGLGYLNEHRSAGEDVSTGTYTFGGKYRWKLSETAELTDDVRFVGTFADTGDWRADNALAVVARLTKLFSLKASNTIRYANTPVPGFKNTDTTTAIALVAKF